MTYLRSPLYRTARTTFWEKAVIFGIVLIIMVPLALLMGWPVMVLWGAVMPDIFPDLPTLSYWQAVQLTWLASFLFKGGSGSSSKD